MHKAGGEKLMKRFLSFISSVMVIILMANVVWAESVTIGSNSSWSSTKTVSDNNLSWYVYCSGVSFYGMPNQWYPSGYELYFRAYTGVNGTMASGLATCRVNSYPYPAGSIGQTGISVSYYSGYGGYGQSYVLKCNSNCSAPTQSVFFNWTA